MEELEEEDFGDTDDKVLRYIKATYYGNWTVDYLDELDTSKYPFPNVLWNVKPQDEIIAKTTSMLVVAVPGIYLNFVILLVLAKNRWLWSASNLLVGNLALMDILTLILCPWFMLVRDFYQAFVLKNFGCRFEGFMQASLLLANVGAVILVSYDRLAVAALNTEARIHKAVAKKLIVASWIIPVVLALPWIIRRQYTERQWLDYLEMYCVDDPKFLGVYWHFILVLLVWVPMSLMILTYGTILWRLEWSARDLTSRGGGKAIARAKSRAMRITACVLLADAVCRLPYSVMIYWRETGTLEINSVDGAYSALWFLANFLMYLNSAINPLIYGFTNTRFRKAMDRTSGVACCRFGRWCCVLNSVQKVQPQDKITEKIFIIDSTPRPSKKIASIIKHILHINSDAINLSVPKLEEATTRPTRVTPLKSDYI